MHPIKDKFLGIWRLCYCTETNPQGDKKYLWGEQAIGYLIYMPENIMAVQIMRRERRNFAANDFMLASAEDCHSLPQDYNAYFGEYEIDEQQQIITHHIAGHLFPNLVGKDNVRRYEFKPDNHLLLTAVGGNNKRDMFWQKVINSSFNQI